MKAPINDEQPGPPFSHISSGSVEGEVLESNIR